MPVTRHPRLPRLLHPVAWWVWAVGLAAAASHTTNPFLLVLIVAVASCVVTLRRELGGTNAFVVFLWIGLLAIALRVLMTMVLGDGVAGQVVLFRLPEIPLPDWTGAIRLGGAVSLGGLLFALYDGMRLAAILACIGAANALASPRRLLRYVPATLYDVGTAVVVGLTYAPQLVEDAGRVRAARRLRGHSGNSLPQVARMVVPVMEGALERSLQLAASMESRGYGRAVHRSSRRRNLASLLAMAGALGVIAGLYGLLDGSAPGLLGLPLLLAGVGLAVLALVGGARRDARSQYRRDPWSAPEWLVLACGLAPAAALFVGGRAGWDGIVPISVPAAFPAVPLPAVLGIALAGLAAVLAPLPPERAARDAARNAERAAGSTPNREHAQAGPS